MPTIAEDSTPQQVFDYVVNHLRTQGVRSAEGSGQNCKYRGPNNTMCAVGCLITDREYDKAMEGHLVGQIVYGDTLMGVFWSRHLQLLSKLQTLHDQIKGDFRSTEFESHTRQIAENFGLTYSPPN